MRNTYKLMTRTAVMLFCCILVVTGLKAQIAPYTFAQTSGTATPITGGTMVAQATTTTGATALDDVNYPGQVIPFTFNYGGTNYTSFNINSNGFITFGATLPLTTLTLPISNTAAYSGAIAGLARNLRGVYATTATATLGSNTLTAVTNVGLVNVGDVISMTNVPAGTMVTAVGAGTITMSAAATGTITATATFLTGQIRVETLGVTPNQITVIQFTRFQAFGVSNTSYSFQIRLYETTNVVDVIYGPFTSAGAGGTPQVGLRGVVNTDFNNRTTTANWAATTAGAVNTATCTLSATVFPASGQTYTWTPPPMCTGTPSAGTTAGPAGACSGTNFTLSLTGATTGVSGLTYQWQSSPDGITYTNIGGATSATASVSQTAVTYYQCVVTCSGSGLSANSVSLLVPMNSFINCYCTSNATNTADEEILNVTLGTLNNSSTCTTTGGAGSILNEYSNFTAVVAPDLQQTLSYPLSVQIGTCGGNYTNSTRVFIDFNQDGDFLDAGETVYTSAAGTVGPHTETGTIAIPVGATVGNTRMRVVTVETGAPTSISSCGTYTWGETEDYFVNITAATPCSGIPSAGTTAGPAGVCSGVNFNLSLTGAGTGFTGLTFQWQSSPDGITYSNIGGATNSTATVSQTAATYYQCILTCTLSGMADTSVALNVPMNPFTGCYCSSAATTTADEEVTNVTLGTLNNTSNCATPAPGPGSILTRYANYMSGAGAPAAPVIARNNPTSISVTVGSCGTFNYNSGLAIFMDLNQNGSFADAGEKVYSNGAAAGIACVPATVVTGTITIPLTANLGITAMRIIDAEGFAGNTITPCLSYGYGETEDYLINIVDLPAAPPAITQSGGTPTCAGGTDLSIAGSPAAGDAWYWQTSPTGTSTTNPVSGPYTVFLNGTYYANTYNATNNLWSATSTSYTVTNIPLAPLPPAPTATTPACLSTSVSVAAATGTTTYYWQGTNPTGTSTAMNAASPYTASASGTYYVAAYDASTSCWSNTNGVAVVIDTYVPPVPTSTTNPLNICVGAVSGMINASSSSTGTLTASFGTSLISTGTVAAVYNVTVPAIPAGATVTGTTLEVIGATALGASYRSEIRVALSGTITLAPYQISTLASPGLITPDPSVTVPSMPAGGGPVTLTLTETFDDGGTDATFNEIRLVVTYTLPASTITWWDASTSGTQVGTGSPFESVGSTILPSTSTTGTYNFYAMATAGTCTSTRLTVPVIVNALPTVTASASATTVCEGSMVTLTGGGASTYTWDNGVTDGVAFPATTATTTYNVIGTSAVGCTNTSSVSLTVNTVPVVSATSTSIACNGGTSTVTVSATSGTPAYTGTGTFTQSAGTTVYTVTDINSCAGTTSVTITEPALLVASSSPTAILCNGGSSTVTVSATGGTAAYTGTGTFTQTAGSTSYTVTDANGCSSTTTATVTEPTVLVLSYSETGVLCNGGTSAVTVSATGGTPAYSGTGTFPQPAGTTTYTVTDANACPSTISVTVTEPTALSATASSTGIACFGGSATVTLNPTGGTSPYTGTGPFTQAPGTTSYTVTDANGCTTSVSVTETEPSELFIGTGATSVMCNGDSATVTISAIGGTPAYTGTGNFMQAAGVVTYTVTDANGCSVSSNVTVTEPTLLVPTASSTAILCNGGTSTVTIAATGGTGAYTGTGSFTQSAGTTVYTVTDANGCSSTVSETITQPTAVMVMYSSTPVLCNGDSSAVTIMGMDGTGPYTGEGTFNQAAGTVSYTITDANGCPGAANVTITEPAAITTTQLSNLCPGQSVTVGTNTYSTSGTYIDVLAAANTCDSTITTTVIINSLPVVTASSDNDTICSGGTVTFTGGGAVTYAWDNSVTDGVVFTPASTGTTVYTVTGTDINGCTNTASTAVTVNTLPVVMASVDNDTICAGNSVTFSGGGAISYMWDNGVTDGIAFTPSATGNTVYTVTGTDVNGCTNTASAAVMVNALPVVTVSFTAPVCLQAVPMALTGGSPAGGIYSGTGVSAGMFDPSVTGVGSFPITYTVTDVNSCTNADTSNITVQDCTGIDEAVSSNDMLVYPNPTIGIFTIEIFNANFSELTITIVDLQGKEVFSSTEKNVSGTFRKSISMEELSKGVYYIKVNTGADVKIQKLIVQ